MSIHYALYETSGIAAGEKKLTPRPITTGRRTTDALARRIESATTATRGDIRLVLAALTDYMADALLDGESVQLDGLGTFSVSVGGEVRNDKNGRPMLHDACVRGVLFRPCRELMHRLSHASFTSRHTSAHRSALLDDTQVRRIVIETLTGRERVSFDELRATLGLTVSTARRRLAALVADGTILAVGTRAMSFYRLP
ncbi:MAG: HU family DNA-binding protein [Bacteroidaceae bacterium]|nr:HU family DNA-binding protein [Bacteroidaceae bacterium]